MSQAEGFSEFAKLAASAEGVTVEQLLAVLKKNATNKQYNITIGFKSTETTGDIPQYDNTGTWTGIPYAIYVGIESDLLKILNKLNHFGKEIATGGAVADLPK